jgi:RNA methyltransferase, TrmH family
LGKLKQIVKRNEGLIIALDGINDPGNLGTIIRTAYWFGVNTIILGKGSTDPYNSKVLRSSQGAVFHINITEDVSLAEELRKLQEERYSVYLFTLNAEESLSQIVQSGKSDKSVLVFGSEAHGISEEIMKGDYKKVKVKGYSDCESLNVAVTCGIALYEFRKNSH